MIQRISHFSFTVSNLRRSIEWYSGLLGLELIHRQRQDNDYTRQFVGVPGAVLEVAILAPKGNLKGPTLELIEYVEVDAAVDTTPVHRGSPAAVGFSHISFLVKDIESLHTRLLASNVCFITAPVRITSGVNEGGLVCYLRDPDDNGLEFFQRARR
jgi:catechol 2,3-dioxygenase-like lactoylglutathione lyase family enzyme